MYTLTQIKLHVSFFYLPVDATYVPGFLKHPVYRVLWTVGTSLLALVNTRQSQITVNKDESLEHLFLVMFPHA